MRFNSFSHIYNKLIIIIIIIITIIIYFQECPEDLQVKSKYVRKCTV